MPSSTYIKSSNNLDSQFYALERVKDGTKDYLKNHYFTNGHQHVVNFCNSWQEQETIQEEVAVVKKPKEKKGMMGMMGKKSKA